MPYFFQHKKNNKDKKQVLKVWQTLCTSSGNVALLFYWCVLRWRGSVGLGGVMSGSAQGLLTLLFFFLKVLAGIFFKFTFFLVEFSVCFSFMCLVVLILAFAHSKYYCLSSTYMSVILGVEFTVSHMQKWMLHRWAIFLFWP